MEATFMAEMTGVFLDEAEEQLQTMDQEILLLERSGGSEASIQSLFRAAHTLKGSSAAMGLEKMKQLTHEMEHLLDLVRNHRLEVTNELVNLLFACLDQLKLLKEQFANGEEMAADITLVLKRLKQFLHPETDVSLGEIPLQPETEIKLQKAKEDGLSVTHIVVRLVSDCPMKSARAFLILNQLEEWGEVLQMHPSLEGLCEEDEAKLAEFTFLLAGTCEHSTVQQHLQSMMDVVEVQVGAYTASKAEVPPQRVSLPQASAAVKPHPSEDNKRKSRTIRVDVERLEMLMNLVGELVIDQTRISQVSGNLHHRYTADEYVADLGQISDHVSRVIGELQESVMKVRMLPIEQLFNRFPRMIRDLSLSLNKEIELVIEGEDTELDRTVIEEIGDPLIHLIRNAVDHGIESTEERLKKGKSAKGLLRITAAHEENQVVITVADDGAGIDPVKMKESALRKGVISEEEFAGISDQDATYLIFRPGFSTAASISDVSGRGVGMDIVKSHIEKLNGVIDIHTRPGEGTQFKIKLPLTLAIITGLLVKVSGSTFILPMNSVVEIVRMPPEAIQTIKGDPAVVIRDRVLPVISLHECFGIPLGRRQRKHQPIVVVGIGERRFALAVDELLGNQEIVVKSLGSYIGKIDGVSGATILGDGRVALIIEVAGIGNSLRQTDRPREGAGWR